ncbi:MAG: hypothetical protein Q7U38_00910, partial [Methylobacter sp.]|nr:hypothetical protein [Methylobacter sp.]
MADFSLATNEVIIARNAGSLYGVILGNAAMTSLVAQAGVLPGALLNSFYLNSVGDAPAGLVADALIKNVGITGPVAVAEAKAYIVGILDATPLDARGVAVNTMLVNFSGLTANPTFGEAATAWNAKIASAIAHASVPTSVNTTFINGSTSAFFLSTGFDNLVGTAGDDVFTARIIDNQNTLQSGDVIKGGAGNDTLIADIGDSQRFAITAETDSVENILIRAQAVSNDNADNNPSVTNRVQIDAQRMAGVTHWESNNSRADLLIEDVRIADGLRTKDVTIAMVETDAGNVDFGVYFDQHSLRNLSSGNTTLTINLMDSGAAATAGTADKPLLNNPYDQFKLFANGELVTIQLNTTDDSKLKVGDADTYEQLLQVFQDALAGNPNLTVSLGADFTIIDPITNTAVTGKSIVVVGSQGTIITAPAGSGWFNTTGASVPATSNIYTTYNDVETTITELVTSKIILDDVGRGSTGGDLVVGAMSTGDTSTSRGVERFEIEVRDNSKLQTINSTNNALREVVITNGETSRVHQQNAGAYTDTVLNEGNLTVNGNALGQAEVGSNIALPGVENNSPAGIHHGVGAAGFTDVRLIDASAFNGKFEFTAAVTTDAISKYINAVDTQGNPFADIAGAGNVNFNVPGANFIYTGGSDNDIMNVTIDGAVAASRSTVVAGKSDFTFNIDGGAGDDNITVRVIDQVLTGGAQNWYNNQDLNNNITINGGDGNDTIRTPGAGDVHILAGAGNDTVYTDNTGVQRIVTNAVAGTTADVFAHWIFNTNDQTVTGAASRNINDVRSDLNDLYNLHGGRLTVNFRGIAATVNIASTDFRTSDLQYNQAIKDAIINNAVLSKLLVAKDGPANSLIVESLIDGVHFANDLTLSIVAPTTLTASDIAAAGAAYGLVAPTEATVLAAMNAAVLAFNGPGSDYASALATDDFLNDIAGANSITTSDNIITPGAGNDVIVLGTTVGIDTALSSNETLIYAPGFGNDTVVNFDAAGNGIDHFDFTALGGTTLNNDFTANRSITIQTFDVNQVNALTLIQANYAANNVAAQQHVFVAVSAHNIASVYSIANPVGAANAVATLEGTIDLADTAWGTLTAANFTNASAANYHLLEGATGAVVVPGPPVVGAIVLVPGTTAPVAATAAADVFSFNVAAAQ